MRRDPLIIRVSDGVMNSMDRLKFISNVKNASVGKNYDSTLLMQYFRLSILDKLGVQVSLFGNNVMQKVR